MSHISRLKCNKSPGHDGIVSEHVVFGGHYLAIHICLLFNAMLKHSSVPIDFSRGIIIPLLKCNKNSSGDEIANVNFLRRYGTYVLQNTDKNSSGDKIANVNVLRRYGTCRCQSLR